MPGQIQLSIDSPPWDAVRRTYRRVCELRAVGRTDEAARIENSDLSAALAVAREVSFDVDEAALLAAEDERVADARLLAELLAPMLAARLPAATRPSASPEPRAPARPVTSVITSPPQVADLIDDMLAQAAGRPRGA